MTHLGGFDGVRAMACLFVIGHHLFQKLDPATIPPGLQQVQGVMLAGGTGVSAFFVLSGTLLALPFWRRWLKGDHMPSLSHYFLRRMSRIAPGFYVSLTASLLVALLVFHVVPDDLLMLRFLSGLAFVNSFHWLTFFPTEANGPLWSIGCEVVAYCLLVPFMALVFNGGIPRKFFAGLCYWLAVLAICVAAHWLIIQSVVIPDEGKGWQFGLVGGAKEWMPAHNPVGLFTHFLLGVIAAGFIGRLELIGEKRTTLFEALGVLLLSSLFVFVAVYATNPEVYGGLLDNLYFWPWFPLLVAALLCVLPFTRWTWRVVDNRPFRFVAKISYGLYIWHYLVIDVVSRTLFPEFTNFSVANWVDWILPSSVVLLFSFTLAILSFYAVEQPAMNWARRIEGRNRAPARLGQAIAAPTATSG